MKNIYSERLNFRRNSPVSITRSFTLIELLVVIAIIAILASMLLPALKSARRRAMLSNCMSNEKQFSMSFDMYTSSYNDSYPFYCYDSAGKNIWAFKMAEKGFIKNLEILFCPDDAMMETNYSTVQATYGICTSFRKNNELPGGASVAWKYITYGYNGVSVGGNGSFYNDMSPGNISQSELAPTLKAGQALKPSKNILLADSYRANNSTPRYGMFGIGPINRKNEGSIAGRHGNSSKFFSPAPGGGSANILFIDGHVENIVDVYNHRLNLVTSNFPDNHGVGKEYGNEYWLTRKGLQQKK